jgi:hypothetical protein
LRVIGLFCGHCGLSVRVKFGSQILTGHNRIPMSWKLDAKAHTSASRPVAAPANKYVPCGSNVLTGQYGESMQIKASRFHWMSLTISIMLILISALCFLKYVAWASLFSGLYGLPSQSEPTALARQWILTYFWVGALLEVALVANLAVSFRSSFVELAGPLRVLGRSLVAIALAALGTLGAVFLFIGLGKVIHH